MREPTVALLRRAVHLVLPPACAGCGEALEFDGGRVCARCTTRLREPPHPRCARCHAPRGTGLPAARPCPECADWPEGLIAARSAAILEPPADTLVYALKYGGWPELAPFMAERMHRILPGMSSSRTLLVVPVPTTVSRERERGYNQAALLAREVGRRAGLSISPALVRHEGGGTQVSLHRRERADNVRDAFQPALAATADVGGREVLLVDDVLTTGATAAAAGLVLLEMGAKSVSVLTFARALPGDPT
jgi:ComF family protein